MVEPDPIKGSTIIPSPSGREACTTWRKNDCGLRLGCGAIARSACGVRSLKIGFNQVFGYYLEVSRSQAGNVPERYIRKQTLANAERFL